MLLLHRYVTIMEVAEKIYQIALSRIKGVGYVLLQKLITQFGSAQAVFQHTYATLVQVPGVGKRLAQAIQTGATLTQAEQCLKAHEKANIRLITPWDPDYPVRLKHIYGVPTLLYLRGNVDLNAVKIISMVGTRRATNYGKKVVATLLEELSIYPLLVVSGLAYGIDIHVHRMALSLGLPTLAVIAGGVDRIYPVAHKRDAEAMLAQGGVLSEHPLHTAPEAYQFVARNRLIAGISDATVVIEAGQKSGALITANYANEYHKEVFAVSGDIFAPYAAGCHELIKTHRAHLLTTAADIVAGMSWEGPRTATRQQRDVVARTLKLTADERKTLQAIGASKVHVDELSHRIQIPAHQLSAILLQLELKQIVRMLPGNKFQLVDH